MDQITVINQCKQKYLLILFDYSFIYLFTFLFYVVVW